MVCRIRHHLRRLAGTEGQRGFTLPEVIVTMAALVVVVLAATVSYMGTLRSWDGTSSMTRLQQDSSLAVETMSRSLRGASSVTIGADGDSVRVFYDTPSGDSLASVYHIDNQGQLVDGAGFVLAADVDSLSFSTSDGKTVNIDLSLRDAMGSECGNDDQGLLMSSTVVLRN